MGRHFYDLHCRLPDQRMGSRVQLRWQRLPSGIYRPLHARATDFVAITTNIYASLGQGIELLFLTCLCRRPPLGRGAGSLRISHRSSPRRSLLMAAGWANRGSARRRLCLMYLQALWLRMDGTAAYVDVGCRGDCLFLFLLARNLGRSAEPAILNPHRASGRVRVRRQVHRFHDSSASHFCGSPFRAHRLKPVIGCRRALAGDGGSLDDPELGRGAKSARAIPE